jgi:hypothetical protein
MGGPPESKPMVVWRSSIFRNSHYEHDFKKIPTKWRVFMCFLHPCMQVYSWFFAWYSPKMDKKNTTRGIWLICFEILVSTLAGYDPWLVSFKRKIVWQNLDQQERLLDSAQFDETKTPKKSEVDLKCLRSRSPMQPLEELRRECRSRRWTATCASPSGRGRQDAKVTQRSPGPETLPCMSLQTCYPTNWGFSIFLTHISNVGNFGRP